MCWISRKVIIGYEDEEIIETTTVYSTGIIINVISNIGYTFDKLIDTTEKRFRLSMED